MTGWKTKIAAAGLVLTGVSVILGGSYVEGALIVLSGLAALGLGHKLDKVRAIFEDLKKGD